MDNKLQSLRGMKDLFGKDFQSHDFIIETAKRITKLYNYSGASTPILEYTKVFDRTLGDSSDVVSKEMYSFLDKSGESVAMRPEFTAGIMRAFISNGLEQKLPLKLFSYGPAFRYDRPQAGRQRQFHQINCEYIGSNNPYADAEIIKLAKHLLQEFNIIDDVTLEINSLGCKESRQAYQDALSNYFRKYKNDLSEDSKNRLEKNNPLRILDSKNPEDKKLSSDAPFIFDYYSKESKIYFDQVLEYLNILNIKYIINPRLARGLDYYCHTAFEFVTEKLGAQSSVLGGGRYDYLCKLMGGSDVPAVGFAAGIERVGLVMNYQDMSKSPIYVMPIGDFKCFNEAIKVIDHLRENQIKAELESNGKVQKRMERVLKNGGEFIIFVGEEEIQNNKFKLKILAQKEEKFLSIKEIIQFFRN